MLSHRRHIRNRLNLSAPVNNIEDIRVTRPCYASSTQRSRPTSRRSVSDQPRRRLVHLPRRNADPLISRVRRPTASSATASSVPRQRHSGDWTRRMRSLAAELLELPELPGRRQTLSSSLNGRRNAENNTENPTPGPSVRPRESTLEDSLDNELGLASLVNDEPENRNPSFRIFDELSRDAAIRTFGNPDVNQSGADEEMDIDDSSLDSPPGKIFLSFLWCEIRITFYL